jgi:hypothetical protein
VRTGREVKALEHPVEVVDDADVVAVDEYLGIAWLHLQPEIAVGERRVGGRIAIRAVRRISIRAVSVTSRTSIPG